MRKDGDGVCSSRVPDARRLVDRSGNDLRAIVRKRGGRRESLMTPKIAQLIHWSNGHLQRGFRFVHEGTIGMRYLKRQRF